MSLIRLIQMHPNGRDCAREGTQAPIFTLKVWILKQAAYLLI